MTEPLITIGITSYNADETILSAINSAIAQDWPNKEILVVDDASTDNSWDVLCKATELYPATIRVVQMDKNGGVAATRNRLINEAHGEFIVFFDDDDTSDPSRIRNQYNRIVQYEQMFAKGAPVICHTARRQHYPAGNTRIEKTVGTNPDTVAPNGNDVVGMILFNRPVAGGNGSMATCSQMARTQTYRQLGGFDEKFRRSEDTDFCLRLARAGGHFVGIADPLVTQKMTYGNEKKLAAERAATLQLFTKHRDILDQYGRASFDLKWINAKYDYLEGKRIQFAAALIHMFLRYPLLTMRRIFLAANNFGYNRVLKKFHKQTVAP